MTETKRYEVVICGGKIVALKCLRCGAILDASDDGCDRCDGGKH